MINKTEILSLTAAAETHIQKMLSQKPGAIGFRLSVKQTGCTGYMYVPEIISSAHPEDLLLRINDISIFINPAAVEMLKGTVIDYAHKSLGVSVLVFNNPNVKSLCGCGESFNVQESLGE